MSIGRKISGFRLAILPAIILSSSAHAGFTYLEGGTGLVAMGTADVLEHATADVGLFASVDAYDDPTGKEYVDYALIPSVTVGLFDFMELGLVAETVQAPHYDVSGVRSSKVFAKFRLSGGDGDPLSVAIAGYSGSTGDAAEGLGSGETTSGGDILFSFYERNYGLHLSLGAHTVDTGSFVAKAGGGWERVFTSGNMKKVGLGFELHPRSDVAVTLEAITTQDEADNVATYVVPGVKFAPNADWAFTVGFAAGNPSDRTPPHTRYFAGVSYGNNDPRRVGRPLGVALRWTDKRPSSGNMDGLANAWFTSTTVTDLERNASQALDTAASRIVAQVSDATASVTTEMLNPIKYRPLMTNGNTQFVKCSKLPTAGSPCTMQVEVINASGDPVLAEKVARMLREDGYDVARVTELDYRQIISWVYYRPGYPDEAVKLAHHIPMDQIVTRELSLDPGITIRVVVGTDMIPLGSKL